MTRRNPILLIVTFLFTVNVHAQTTEEIVNTIRKYEDLIYDGQSNIKLDTLKILNNSFISYLKKTCQNLLKSSLEISMILLSGTD